MFSSKIKQNKTGNKAMAICMRNRIMLPIKMHGFRDYWLWYNNLELCLLQLGLLKIFNFSDPKILKDRSYVGSIAIFHLSSQLCEEHIIFLHFSN